MYEITDYKRACDTIYETLKQLGPFSATASPHSIKTIRYVSALLSRIPWRNILIKEPLALKKLASKSYAHENGFLKLTLVDPPNARFRVRLHFWCAQIAAPISLENIHNHRFNYYSYLLSGTLQNKVWKTGTCGVELMHFRYYPRLRKQSYRLEYCGETALETLSDTLYQRGDLYCMKAGDLHTANVLAGSNTITLFIEERSNLRKHADVFSNEYTPKDVSRWSPSFTSAQYLEILTSIDALL